MLGIGLGTSSPIVVVVVVVVFGVDGEPMTDWLTMDEEKRV